MHNLCRLLKEKILDPALRIASPRVHEICTLDNYVLNTSFAHEIEIKLLVTFIASPVILRSIIIKLKNQKIESRAIF
jgi:hypothetical protein